MSQPSQRSSESRMFETAFGPRFADSTDSSDIDPVTQTADTPALTSSTITLAYPKFEAMFHEAAKKRNRLPTSRKRKNVEILQNVYDYRIQGGDDKPQSCKYKPPASLTVECMGESRGLQYFQPNPNVTVINVKLSDSKTNFKQFAKAQCKEDQRKIMRIKTRGTQTLYRESSAQTLPYLPGVSNDVSELDNLELFKLPTILPGDGPPGLYEVEVLERARKRWAFTRALKENFRRQLDECKENVTQAQKRQVIEAFEWEHWMEREEHIQECQMLRLEIVIRMFEKREKQMHEASKKNIQISHAKIAAKREAGLRKNEIEYARQIRRLEMNKRNIPRNWRKESIISLLGNPSAEFFAPQMRYGVNPNRRHFVADRKAFEIDMIELERKAVNTNELTCPFAKLKKWAKPKSRVTEIEQNFCSDANLKKLYEDLKKLREKQNRQKQIPKCLKEKVKQTEVIPEIDDDMESLSSVVEESEEPEPEPEPEEDPRFEEEMKAKESDDVCKEMKKAKRRSEQFAEQSRADELETMLTEYEGTTIGWLMKFLSDELIRLQEQRNLQFLTMMAQKERWRREAAEAGLRQKENDMRAVYQKLYQETNDASVEVCSEYLKNIFDVDIQDYAEEKATNSIIELAKLIDRDIQRWLDSLKEIQNPLNYQMLRYLLRDIIFPNVQVLIKRYECELVVDGIINDVLFPHVYKLLEPYDVSFAIASDMIDRLIDNDLYLFSDDSSVSSSGDNTIQEREARAILRKLIRQAVPGRRWMTPTERFGNVCVGDLLDTIFDRIKIEEERAPKECRQNYDLIKQASFLDLTHREKTSQESTDSISDQPTIFLRSVDFSPYGDIADIDTTKMLQSAFSIDNLALTMSMRARELEMHPIHTPTDDSGTDLSFIGVREDRPKRVSHKTARISDEKETSAPSLEDARKFLHKLIQDVINSFIPHEEGSDEGDFFFGEEGEEEFNGDDEYKSFVTDESEEASADDPESALKAILCRVFQTILPSEYADWEDSGDFGNAGEADIEAEEEEFVVSVNESEIKMLDVIRCKCEAEKEREYYIREMLRRGKVRVIRKPRPVNEEEDGTSDSNFSIGTFEYDGISMVEPTTTRPIIHIKEAGSQKSMTSIHTVVRFRNTDEGLKVIIEYQTPEKADIVEEGEQQPEATEAVEVVESIEEINIQTETVEYTETVVEVQEITEAVEAQIESVAEVEAAAVEERFADVEASEVAAHPEAVAEPVSEVVAEPVSEAVAEPVAEAVAEPVSEAVVEPVSEAVAEPVFEAVAEPVSEAVAEPVSEAVAEPVADAAAEPEAVPEPQPAVSVEAPQNVEENIENPEG